MSFNRLLKSFRITKMHVLAIGIGLVITLITGFSIDTTPPAWPTAPTWYGWPEAWRIVPYESGSITFHLWKFIYDIAVWSILVGIILFTSKKIVSTVFQIQKKMTKRAKTEMMQIAKEKDQKSKIFEYDVSISFAGEDREIAENLAIKLETKGIKVFYDKFHKSDLWGKRLGTYFQDVYGPKTKFVVPLISKYYPIKDWTDFEFSIMRDEAKKRKREFILPVKLDDTKILGIHEDVGYLDYREEGIDGVIDCLLEKLS